jgi:hypothetical protein
LDGNKIFIAVLITSIVLVIVVIGLPAVKLFVGVPDYDLYVDAKINKQNSLIIGQVLIQNIGSQPLTNVKVDFGEGDIIDLGTIDARHKMILTSPPDNKMESVTVSADQDIFVNNVYREE